MVCRVSDLAARDRDRPEPVYAHVAADIRARITTGELAPGTRLLSERDLAIYYRVAYVTLRKATKLLREQGYIESIHGQGTFVREREFWQSK
jgi:GntR family transcriptional regulator